VNVYIFWQLCGCITISQPDFVVKHEQQLTKSDEVASQSDVGERYAQQRYAGLTVIKVNKSQCPHYMQGSMLYSRV